MCVYINKNVGIYTEISIWYFSPTPHDAHEAVNPTPLASAPETPSRSF